MSQISPFQNAGFHSNNAGASRGDIRNAMGVQNGGTFPNVRVATTACVTEVSFNFFGRLCLCLQNIVPANSFILSIRSFVVFWMMIRIRHDDKENFFKEIKNLGNRPSRETLTRQWPPEEVLRQPDFGEQEDPLPNGWVSRFDQLSGEEYFVCAETENLVFSREDLFRKKPATNSVSSRRSVSSPAWTSSSINTTTSDRPNSSTRASPRSKKISRPDFVESSFVTPPALGKGSSQNYPLGKGSSQNYPIIFSDDDEEKSFGSADLPDTRHGHDGGNNDQQVQR
jgi:hypothetical protein